MINSEYNRKAIDLNNRIGMLTNELLQSMIELNINASRGISKQDREAKIAKYGRDNEIVELEDIHTELMENSND